MKKPTEVRNQSAAPINWGSEDNTGLNIPFRDYHPISCFIPHLIVRPLKQKLDIFKGHEFILQSRINMFSVKLMISRQTSVNSQVCFEVQLHAVHSYQFQTHQSLDNWWHNTERSSPWTLSSCLWCLFVGFQWSGHMMTPFTWLSSSVSETDGSDLALTDRVKGYLTDAASIVPQWCHRSLAETSCKLDHLFLFLSSKT